MECNRKLNYQLLYAVPWGLGIRAVGQPAWQGETNQPPPQLNQFLILLQLRITPLGGLTRLHSITSGRTDRLCLHPPSTDNSGGGQRQQTQSRVH